MWMMSLHLHVYQKSDYDYDDLQFDANLVYGQFAFDPLFQKMCNATVTTDMQLDLCKRNCPITSYFLKIDKLYFFFFVWYI